MKANNMKEVWGERIFLVAYIMEELYKDNSEFGAFIDLLPDTVERFPLMFDDETMKYLEESPFLEYLMT